MLTDQVDWGVLKSKFKYVESDSLARIRTSENALAWLQVYLNDASGQPFIRRYGKWEAIDGMAGFDGFERIKVKQVLNTATGEMVPAGV